MGLAVRELGVHEASRVETDTHLLELGDERQQLALKRCNRLRKQGGH